MVHLSFGRFVSTAVARSQGAGSICRVDARFIPFFLWRRVLFVRVRLYLAGINRHLLAVDQTLLNATEDGLVEQMAQQVTPAESAMLVLGNGRVFWQPVI